MLGIKSLITLFILVFGNRTANSVRTSGQAGNTGSRSFQYLISVQQIQKSLQLGLVSCNLNDHGIFAHIYNIASENIYNGSDARSLFRQDLYLYQHKLPPYALSIFQDLYRKNIFQLLYLS